MHFAAVSSLMSRRPPAKRSGVEGFTRRRSATESTTRSGSSTPCSPSGVLDSERVVDSVALLRLVNPSTPLRFAGGRRDMSDETAAKCIYVGMSAGIAGPLLTSPGVDFDDDRELAIRSGYAVGRKAFPS